jgi:hypothetical protein
VLTNCYLTHLPRKFMRSAAGFNPSMQGNFYLPRARVSPLRSLEQAIWLFVDKWLAWFDDSDVGAAEEVDGKPESSYASPYAPHDREKETVAEAEADRHDFAAQGFLRLLQQLRVMLLQDSVIMRREFPVHPLWSDPYSYETTIRYSRRMSSSLC